MHMMPLPICRSGWRLTGQQSHRVSFFGKVILQVQEEQRHGYYGDDRKPRWNRTETRWRDATAEDQRLVVGPSPSGLLPPGMNKGGHNDLGRWRQFGGTLDRPPPPAPSNPRNLADAVRRPGKVGAR